MRTLGVLISLPVCGIVVGPTRADEKQTRTLEPVAYSDVRLSDGFWAPRIEINRRVGLPAAFRECEKAGNIGNFRIAAGLGSNASPAESASPPL